ncbi:MAG: beta-propeller fold lactonase family protein [Legionella sp.]|uniref:lactonase family protein n=1 Tax=Legionella sp. TaxID=459 RepID=UPI0028431719|nr:beta-propeller fold lactonase family protein [Legionella sp.]
MIHKGLLGLLLLFAQQTSAGTPPVAETSPKNTSDAIAELTLTVNDRNAVVCSNFVQNCTINVGTLGCVNPPGFITVTNNSIVKARNITASSTDASYLNNVSQNNRCPAILGPKASCSISFTSNNPNAFYVPNVVVQGSNTNAAFFNINALQCTTPQTGALEPIPGSPFTSGNFAYNLAATPDSRFLYVANLSGGATAYTIAPTTGILTPVAGSPYNSGNGYAGVAVSANGQYVYYTDFNNLNVAQFSINQTTGVLSSVDTYAAGVGPAFIGLSPNGQFAYVANENGGNVSAYTVDPTTGALNQLSTSPYPAGGSSQPVGLIVTPNGQFLYVIDYMLGRIYGYTINQTTGELTDLPDSPFLTGMFPGKIITNSTGTFVYVAANNGGPLKATAYDTAVWIYSANPTTGTLTDVTPTPITTGASSIALTPDDKFAYTTSFNQNTVNADSVDSTTGALSTLPNGPYATGNGPTAIIVTPNGSFVYVVNLNDGNISSFVIH